MAVSLPWLDPRGEPLAVDRVEPDAVDVAGRATDVAVRTHLYDLAAGLGLDRPGLREPSGRRRDGDRRRPPRRARELHRDRAANRRALGVAPEDRRDRRRAGDVLRVGVAVLRRDLDPDRVAGLP